MKVNIKINNAIVKHIEYDNLDNIIQAVIELYQDNPNCFEEFIENSNLELQGLPLYLQVSVYCKLKNIIDGDDILISNSDELETQPLADYLN